MKPVVREIETRAPEKKSSTKAIVFDSHDSKATEMMNLPTSDPGTSAECIASTSSATSERKCDPRSSRCPLRVGMVQARIKQIICVSFVLIIIYVAIQYIVEFWSSSGCDRFLSENNTLSESIAETLDLTSHSSYARSIVATTAPPFLIMRALGYY